jgi:hypothetical protein
MVQEVSTNVYFLGKKLFGMGCYIHVTSQAHSTLEILSLRFELQITPLFIGIHISAS